MITMMMMMMATSMMMIMMIMIMIIIMMTMMTTTTMMMMMTTTKTTTIIMTKTTTMTTTTTKTMMMIITIKAMLTGVTRDADVFAVSAVAGADGGVPAVVQGSLVAKANDIVQPDHTGSSRVGAGREEARCAAEKKKKSS
jgi:hypothetical protein